MHHHMPLVLNDHQSLGIRIACIVERNDPQDLSTISSQQDPHQRITTILVDAHGFPFIGDNTPTLRVVAVIAED